MMPDIKRPVVRWGVSGVIILMAVILYTLLMQFQFTAQSWPELGLNLGFALAAGWSAWRVSRLWRRFAPTDSPRRVWHLFAIGLWCWTTAELLWALMAFLYGEALPVATIADLAWVVGSLVLIVALASQYRLLYRWSAPQLRWFLAAVFGGLLLLSGGATWLVPPLLAAEVSRGEFFLLIFYPLSDLLVAVGALVIARYFGQGQFARPWYTLFVFSISDALYTWLVSEGTYVIVGNSNALTTLTDVLYLGAYLLLGWACQAQEFLLLYGPRWQRLKTLPTQHLGGEA